MRAINADLVVIAEAAVGDARAVVRNAGRALRRAARAGGKAPALINELARTAGVVEQIAPQTRLRLAGGVPDGDTDNRDGTCSTTP